MSVRTLIVKLGVAAALGAALSTGTVATAHATSIQAEAPTTTAAPVQASDASPAWFGDIHVTVNTATKFGGWVDGNGPDSYQVLATCKDGSPREGATRWAGDRRGSFVSCSSGFAQRFFDLIPA
ncbi:hypothetical protein ABTX60_42100 [Streptomyces sp. NPDC126510]|uniref:hypothetical protein n=1 Tax=Streptomyces sp. NPDC126510 TaxID=3155317 RepID=UPI003322BA62